MTTNRVCGNCDGGLSFDLGSQSSCKPVTGCNAEQYMSTASTPTTNRVCLGAGHYVPVRHSPCADRLHQCPRSVRQEPLGPLGHLVVRRSARPALPRTTRTSAARRVATRTCAIPPLTAPTSSSDRVCAACDGVTGYQNQGTNKLQSREHCLAGEYISRWLHRPAIDVKAGDCVTNQ